MDIAMKIREALQELGISLFIVVIGLVGGIGAIVLFFCRSQVFKRRRK
jgi:hypothetical protein